MSSKRNVPPTSATHDDIGFDPARDPQRTGHWSQMFIRAPYSDSHSRSTNSPSCPEQIGSAAFGFPMYRSQRLQSQRGATTTSGIEASVTVT